MLMKAERIIVEEGAGCAPRFFEGKARLQKPFIIRFVWQPYGGGRDLSLWRI
jgi:hypothetical protein